MKPLIQIIAEIARIPSFSSYEERIHPYIINKTDGIKQCNVEIINERNIVAHVPGDTARQPVALTAHLDKINHFGKIPPDELPVKEGLSFLKGQLDNSVGLGIILRLAQLAEYHSWPPLYLLMSEMEESYGLKHHPELLRNQGKELYHGMGADKISDYLINNNISLQSAITVDTTPIFRGERGVALYSGHWKFTKQEPGNQEKAATKRMAEQFHKIDPDVLLSNNTNDYLTYGKRLNAAAGKPIPSIAIEPAIYPYHQKGEQVYYSDIERVYEILKSYLSKYA